MSRDFISSSLEGLGWTPYFNQQLLSVLAESATEQRSPERVIADLGVEYALAGSEGVRRAVLAGRLALELKEDLRPCVGDFVLATASPPGELCRIEHVFERANVFRRKSVGASSSAQPVAANVDVAIVVSSLTATEADPHAIQHGLNQRRLERYLRGIRDAGARAVIVLSKADLHPDPDGQARELAQTLNHDDILAISAHTGHGLEALERVVERGMTAVLVGSSGVGKSSLVNRWLGREVQRVQAVRERDTRGRHTTSHRELFALPNGGLLIDTPGMREFGLYADEDTDLDSTAFQDIDALARDCKFTDCKHDGEPGCAVLLAVERGELDAERLDHARKLLRELRWQQSRHDVYKRAAERQQHKALSRTIRSRMRAKGRVD